MRFRQIPLSLMVLIVLAYIAALQGQGVAGQSVAEEPPSAPKYDTYVKAPPPQEFLQRLRKTHPRLILLDEELPKIKAFLEQDVRGKAWYRNARERAEELYARPVVKHELPDGRRLLSISRDVLDRMYHWCFFYRMEKDKKWLDRAWREMEVVAEFPDWNPSHYLDTAEMMHALAIGYDWLYQDLTEAQRKVIREALWRHGLRLSYSAYKGLKAEGQQSWTTVTNNWNFVCNGGSSIAAMALLDEMPDECSEVLYHAFQRIQIPLQGFEPDGAWWEGLGYWGYSMRYFCPYLRALETAFGTDFGFIEALKNTGFAKAGDFPVYLVSPFGTNFNFADSGSDTSHFSHWALFYLADKFENPLYQSFQEERTSGGLQDILYFRDLGKSGNLAAMPLDKHFRGAELASMRSSWTDPNALFVAIKCGKNGISHAHQDLGSFIFYALGERWFIDPGTESQTYLSHQHHLPRSHFYRIREEGHNTLVFNPDEGFSQSGSGTSKIIRMVSSADEAFAIADLTDAYRRHGVSVKRGYRLTQGRSVFLVQDEIESDHDNEVWWFAHSAAGTKFSLTDNGRHATLERSGKTCHVYLLAPSDAVFQVMDAKPLPSSPNPSIQNPNQDMKKLAIHLPKVQNVTLAVLFVPVPSGQRPSVTTLPIRPLENW